MPTEAARPVSWGRKRIPAGSTSPPAPISLPVSLIHSPRAPGRSRQAWGPFLPRRPGARPRAAARALHRPRAVPCSFESVVAQDEISDSVVVAQIEARQPGVKRRVRGDGYDVLIFGVQQ